jgi:hypothetical protein
MKVKAASVLIPGNLLTVFSKRSWKTLVSSLPQRAFRWQTFFPCAPMHFLQMPPRKVPRKVPADSRKIGPDAAD